MCPSSVAYEMYLRNMMSYILKIFKDYRVLNKMYTYYDIMRHFFSYYSPSMTQHLQVYS